jgi:DNA-directed RNA polymerase specialized sigma24 family protein
VHEAAREKWSLTQDAFDRLLSSLGPDRDAAAERYLEIRSNLVRLFEWRGCSTPDEYADETLNRCARKIGEGIEIRDVATYAIGVARMVLREVSRDRAKTPLPLEGGAEPRAAAFDPEPDVERRLACLEGCLGQLSLDNRDLILRYYQGERASKIENRKGLARLFRLPAATLRMRALRLRESLQACSEKCLHETGMNRL